jgi:hypothetical protein
LISWLKGDARLDWMGFRQQGEHHQQIDQGDAHRHRQGQVHIHLPQQPPQGWAEDEPQAKGHTDQAKGLGALFRRRDVGQHGGGGGGGAAAETVDQPPRKQQRQG